MQPIFAMNPYKIKGILEKMEKQILTKTARIYKV